MTEKTKDRFFQWGSSIITSIFVVIIGFSLNASRDDSKEFKEEVKSKVSIAEFYEKNAETDEKITKTNIRIDNIELDQKTLIQTNNEIKVMISEINTNMGWIIKWRDEQIQKNKHNND